MYDTLPSPVNLHLRKKIKNPRDSYIGGVGSLKHILSSCQTALTDRRYRWHHDQILKEVVEAVNTAIRTNTPNYQKNLIRFVRAGVKTKPKEGNTPKATLTDNRLGTEG